MEHSRAFFVSMPFRIEDLRVIHLLSHRKPYVIVKTVELARIDYENLITDLCVDRRFIEKYKNLCMVDGNGVWHCIFAKQRDRTDGVLIMPDGRDFPKWAAYISGEDGES